MSEVADAPRLLSRRRDEVQSRVSQDIYCDDCLDELKRLPDNSINLVTVNISSTATSARSWSISG